MHQDGTPSYSPRRAKKRRQGLALRVERRYEPDLARQAQALLRLLGARDVTAPGDTDGRVDEMPKEDMPKGHAEGQE